MKKILSSKRLGILLGSILLIGGILAVAFISKRRGHEEPPELIRPVKYTVVQEPFVAWRRKYPGRVKASIEVELAFQVDGPIIKFPVKSGDRVEEGQFLARLDPRDYLNSVESAQAEYDKSKTYLERIEKAVKTGAVSRTELTNAQAAFDVAKANLKTAEKALDDTILVAKFDGIVADTFVENFQNVKAKEPILSLQDISEVEILINVTEERVIVAKEGQDIRYAATFEYAPGRRFDVTLKEFSTEADPLTQTYEARFTMPNPEDIMILPGMTATVMEFPPEKKADKAQAFLVPIEAMVISEEGKYYTWSLEPYKEDLFSCKQTTVQAGDMVEDSVIIQRGLEAGQKIVTAGVHLIEDGQTVRLMGKQGGQE
ncbi:Solvent efflux pump periplasmic linker SrpA precursor [Anaerohalosphaera lusitana]|uniref:Solvent efflux pump periplasmic linker SrpA n=1 Tax=Anaerohalosphaera lusitana TaxID=1936003 RepID=A0A1U9NJ04_9BACT|nr:efflux RND transporter periplasmic adaptor subunit [Anaerohalosphaera lusitana]AQT67901.1 Solvent efflux pump periplasmic linker SrpA precursor [Anaerohalosphaera lusitana]